VSLALALTEADGAMMLLGGARQFERSVLRRGETDADPLSEPCTPAPFEISLLRAHQPRVLADLGTSGVSPAAACPGVSPGPALSCRCNCRTARPATSRCTGRWARRASQDAMPGTWRCSPRGQRSRSTTCAWPRTSSVSRSPTT
jgi:hypothetical protein